MAQGWHGDSEGHARAGRLGGKRSAEVRKARQTQFGERIEQTDPKKQEPPKAQRDHSATSSSRS